LVNNGAEDVLPGFLAAAKIHLVALLVVRLTNHNQKEKFIVSQLEK
jgi:hypothetical protein